jgi:hypothetical protein
LLLAAVAVVARQMVVRIQVQVVVAPVVLGLVHLAFLRGVMQ